MQDMRLGYFVEPLDKFDRTQLRMTVDSWSNALRSHRFPKSSIQFFHNEGKLLKAINGGELDAAILYGYQIAQFRDRIPVTPAILLGEAQAPKVKLILLVRTDSKITSLDQLRGKRIMVDTARLGKLPFIWLRRCLADESVPATAEDFANLEPVHDAFHSLAPVFFKNADACILTRRGYARNAELNQQLVDELKVLKESEPLASKVLVFSETTKPARRKAILEQSGELPPAVFEQSFIRSSVEVLTAIKEDDLKSIGDLVSESTPPVTVSDFYAPEGEAEITTTIDNSPKPEGQE